MTAAGPITGFARPASLGAAARTVREVAARHAEAVDREARFPAEAVTAMRECGLLGAAVPVALGGLGASVAELAATCYELGQGCGSAAMVFAMHQIQVACLLRHGTASSWHADYMARLAREQLLLASATTEGGGIGGDVRRSDCAVADADGRVIVEKSGCVISYAEASDAVLVTARRHPDAVASDQVILVAERGQCRLERTTGWDSLGMRGTCSEGFRLAVNVVPEQVLPAPYAEISAQTMLPMSHITWAALWCGIATAAIGRARASLRARGAADRGAGVAPSGPQPGAVRLAEALAQLATLRAHVAEAVRRYEAALGEPDRLGAISFALAMNQLKTAASTMAVQITGQALLVAGLAGYRNDSPHSIGRHLRDVHSAALMINNDRITGNSAALLAAWRGEEPLFA